MKLKAAFHHYYTMAPYLLKNLSPSTACWRIITKRSHVAYVMHYFELNQQVEEMRRIIRRCHETK